MKKTAALIFLALFQILIFLALFGIIPLDDSFFFEKMNRKPAEKALGIMIDSFLELKIIAQAAAPKKPPIEAWVYIDEVEKENEVEFELYDSRGVRMSAPGAASALSENIDPAVLDVIKSRNGIYRYKDGRVFYAVPLNAEKKCLICHDGEGETFIGAASISYNEDKIKRPLFYINITLLVLSFLNTFAAIFIVLHDPYAGIKELFDKK